MITWRQYHESLSCINVQSDMRLLTVTEPSGKKTYDSDRHHWTSIMTDITDLMTTDKDRHQ